MPRCKYGTKPKNHPGRKNERRIAALKRIDRQVASGVRLNDGCEYPLAAGALSRLNREADALALRIIPAEQARAIRTKKDRTGTGKLRRPA